ncbi:MAG: glycoside hydrolase family 3 C-terminal domain-containing protein [Bacteroidales bacterium]
MEKYMGSPGVEDPHVIIRPETHSWGVEFVERPEEADCVVLWLIPNTGGLFGSAGEEIRNELSRNNIEVAYVNWIKAMKPTVVAINFSNPWVIGEIDNEDLHSVLATFGTTTDALLDVLSGRFAPTGRLPFSIPASAEAVQSNRADLPGAMEEEGYAVFDFGGGISY